MLTENPTIVEALLSLVPNAKFTLRGTDYSGLEWVDDAAKPSQAEVDAELIRLQTEWDANQYQRDRILAYPSIGDQLDMIMKDNRDGTTTHQEACEAVKTTYSK